MVLRLRLVLGLALAALFALPVAQPVLAQPDPLPPMFVGQIDDTDAFIGIVTGADGVLAYACDGTGNSIADVFHGSTQDASGGVLSLPAPGGDSLALNLDADSLPGAIASGAGLSGALVRADGSRHAFTAAPAGQVGKILWTNQIQPDGTTSTGGWVVLDDGQMRGSITQSTGGPSGTAFTMAMSTGPGGNAIQVQTYSSTIDIDSPDFVPPMTMSGAHDLARDLQLNTAGALFDFRSLDGTQRQIFLSIPSV
jgi:hypothetical protein